MLPVQFLCLEFDCLGCNSVEQMHKDWFGEGTSLCSTHGGIKSKHDSKQWRKFLGTDANKRGVDEKCSKK